MVSVRKDDYLDRLSKASNVKLEWSQQNQKKRGVNSKKARIKIHSNYRTSKTRHWKRVNWNELGKTDWVVVGVLRKAKAMTIGTVCSYDPLKSCKRWLLMVLCFWVEKERRIDRKRIVEVCICCTEWRDSSMAYKCRESRTLATSVPTGAVPDGGMVVGTDSLKKEGPSWRGIGMKCGV